jgi:hypothetical protein
VSAALRLSVSTHRTSFLLHNAGISKHNKVVSRQIKVCHQIEAHKFRACRPYLSFAELAKSDGAGVLSAQIFSLRSSAPFQHRKTMTFRKTEYKITVLGSGGVGKTGKVR